MRALVKLISDLSGTGYIDINKIENAYAYYAMPFVLMVKQKRLFRMWSKQSTSFF